MINPEVEQSAAKKSVEDGPALFKAVWEKWGNPWFQFDFCILLFA